MLFENFFIPFPNVYLCVSMIMSRSFFEVLFEGSESENLLVVADAYFYWYCILG